MEKEEVLKLASLARIEISEKEAEDLSGELDSILEYVGDIKSISEAHNLKLKTDNFSVRNVMREDENPHESSVYTKEILEQAPSSEGDYIKVKKIL